MRFRELLVKVFAKDARRVAPNEPRVGPRRSEVAPKDDPYDGLKERNVGQALPLPSRKRSSGRRRGAQQGLGRNAVHGHERVPRRAKVDQDRARPHQQDAKVPAAVPSHAPPVLVGACVCVLGRVSLGSAWMIVKSCREARKGLELMIALWLRSTAAMKRSLICYSVYCRSFVQH